MHNSIGIFLFSDVTVRKNGRRSAYDAEGFLPKCDSSCIRHRHTFADTGEVLYQKRELARSHTPIAVRYNGRYP